MANYSQEVITRLSSGFHQMASAPERVLHAGQDTLEMVQSWIPDVSASDILKNTWEDRIIMDYEDKVVAKKGSLFRTPIPRYVFRRIIDVPFIKGHWGLGDVLEVRDGLDIVVRDPLGSAIKWGAAVIPDVKGPSLAIGAEEVRVALEELNAKRLGLSHDKVIEDYKELRGLHINKDSPLTKKAYRHEILQYVARKAELEVADSKKDKHRIKGLEEIQNSLNEPNRVALAVCRIFHGLEIIGLVGITVMSVDSFGSSLIGTASGAGSLVNSLGSFQGDLGAYFGAIGSAVGSIAFNSIYSIADSLRAFFWTGATIALTAFNPFRHVRVSSEFFGPASGMAKAGIKLPEIERPRELLEKIRQGLSRHPATVQNPQAMP